MSFGEMPETTSPKVKVEGEKKEETKGGGDTSKSKDDVKKEEQKGDRVSPLFQNLVSCFLSSVNSWETFYNFFNIFMWTPSQSWS